MLVKFTPFEKLIEGVHYDLVAKDECGSLLELTIDFDNLSVIEMIDGNIRVKIGPTIWFCRSIEIVADCCEHNPNYVEFKGYLGAPGHGKSWECKACGESLWGYDGNNLTPFKDLDPSVYIVSAEDVI